MFKLNLVNNFFLQKDNIYKEVLVRHTLLILAHSLCEWQKKLSEAGGVKKKIKMIKIETGYLKNTENLVTI